jgi:ankyrin repeat protein
METTDGNGRTALQSAVLGGHDLILMLLVQKGADVDTRVTAR